MQSQLRNSIQVVDGKVQPKDAGVTMDQLVEQLVTDKVNAQYIAAPVGSGVGTANNGNGSAVLPKMNLNGSKDEKINAAVAMNPALANLPRN